MKIILCADTAIGESIAEFLMGEDIVGLGTVPSRDDDLWFKKNSEFCISSFYQGNVKQFNILTAELIDELRPDIVLLIQWPHLISKDIVDLVPMLNLHLGLLPWNRGANPNYWAITEKTPAGVTIHQVDSGIDSGLIISQKEIPVYETDNGSDVYKRLAIAAVDLFKETWLMIKARDIIPLRTNEGGSIHYRKQFSKKLDLTSEQEHLLRTIRALTFEGAPLPFYVSDGIRYEIELTIKKLD